MSSPTDLVSPALEAAERIARIASDTLAAAASGLAEIRAERDASSEGSSPDAPLSLRGPPDGSAIAERLECVVASLDALPWEELAAAGEADLRALRRLAAGVRQLAGSIRSLAAEDHGLLGGAPGRLRQGATELRRFGEWLEGELDRTSTQPER